MCAYNHKYYHRYKYIHIYMFIYNIYHSNNMYIIETCVEMIYLNPWRELRVGGNDRGINESLLFYFF